MRRLTKLRELAGVDWGHPGEVPVSSDTESTAGHHLDVGYCIEGWFFDPPCIGRSMVFFRTNRNGVPCLGLFVSSEVTDTSEDEIRTVNSVYQIEIL